MCCLAQSACSCQASAQEDFWRASTRARCSGKKLFTVIQDRFEVAEMEKRIIEGSTNAERVTLPYRCVAVLVCGTSRTKYT